MPRLRADRYNEVWLWYITYLPTTVRGIWLYLYMVIDVCSPRVVAWDVAEREDLAIAADLVSRAFLRERISKGRQQPLILHADNGTACVRTPGEPAGGVGRAQILSQAKGLKRQPVLGIVVPNTQVPTRLPQPAVWQQRRGLRLGGGVRRLVQSPALSQRHQVRDASPVPLRPSR